MNDLQKYLKVRQITIGQIAAGTGFHYFSIQKTINGQRTIHSALSPIANFLGLDADKLWGKDARSYLKKEIASAIDARARCERDRLRSRYLRDSPSKVSKHRKVSNA